MNFKERLRRLKAERDRARAEQDNDVDFEVVVVEQRVFYRRSGAQLPNDFRDSDIVVDVTSETERRLSELGVDIDAKNSTFDGVNEFERGATDRNNAHFGVDDGR